MVWPLSSVAFQFEPGVVGIDRAAGEKMANFLGAHDDIDAHGVAAAQRGLYEVQGSGDRWNSSARACFRTRSDFGFRFLAHGECSGQFRLTRRSHLQSGLQRRLCRRQSKNIHRKCSALQECLGEFQLWSIFVRRGQRGVRTGEAM